MKILTFQSDRGPTAGILVGERVLDVWRASDGEAPASTVELLACEGALRRAGALAGRALEDAAFRDEFTVDLAEARLLAPVPRPGKVVCLGLNYRDHAAEGGEEVPGEPIIFSKASTSVIGPGESVVVPQASHKVDYEVELAFVIGRGGKCIAAGEAMRHVAGYTVLNDVSARDYQHEKPGRQWYLAKSFDTFCPIGPWIVTADEVGDPHCLDISCTVSGQLMQSSSTAEMAFRIPQIIEYVSRVFTLEPGDVVATGTPPGVGGARTPPRFLHGGDVVVCTVEKIGSLVNPVR